MTIEKIAQLTGHNASIYALCPGKDHKTILSGGGDGWIVEWNLDAPDMGQLLAKVETQIFSLCKIEAESLVVVGNMNGGVHWVDIDHPDETLNVAHHQKGVFGIIQVGEHVFTAGGTGMLTKWSINKRRTLESLQLSYSSLRTIAYSVERQELAVGASDQNIYLLDAHKLELKHTISAAHENSVFALQYLPNSPYLFSGSRDAHFKIWDLDQSYTTVSDQPAHWFTVNDIAIHPSHQYVATASRDKTIKIWNTQDFKLVKVLDTFRDSGHINSVNALLWSADGRYLLSASDDRTIVMWGVGVEGFA